MTSHTNIITHPTYDEIHRACVDMVQQVLAKGIAPTKVLGLARGGLLPAVIISHLLNCPMAVANYSSKSGVGDDKNHDNVLPSLNEKTILLVDDICDSGKTLAEVFQHYTLAHRGRQAVFSVVLYYKENDSFIPDFYWQKLPRDSEWIVFPFE